MSSDISKSDSCSKTEDGARSFALNVAKPPPVLRRFEGGNSVSVVSMLGLEERLGVDTTSDSSSEARDDRGESGGDEAILRSGEIRG